MYQLLKKTAFAIVPKPFLIKHELFFRSIFAFRFTGKKHSCNICHHNLKRFINITNGDLLCPFCGSRARTRRLYKFLQDKSLLHGCVLHFSPSRSLYRIFSKLKDIDYRSTDFENEFLADFRYDITNIDCENESFDLIICYHILEHITEDEKAMRELARVLKPNGVCIIQTPFKEGDVIYEDSNIVKEEDRLEAFGQRDHVRIYSIYGLMERLKTNHFKNCVCLDFEDEPYLGFKKESFIIAKK